jgi:anti-anti-sigma factor
MPPAAYAMSEGHRLHETSIPGRGIDPVDAFAVEPTDGPDGISLIALAGELDMAATPELRRHVDAAAGRRGVVIDLGEATFIDSAVLKELLRANTELARYETTVVLVRVPPPVQRLLDLTRTARLFTIEPDREAALGRIGSG